MRELRIVYMGTPDFAVYPLQKLLEAGHKVVAVVTNPDKPAGSLPWRRGFPCCSRSVFGMNGFWRS